MCTLPTKSELSFFSLLELFDEALWGLLRTVGNSTHPEAQGNSIDKEPSLLQNTRRSEFEAIHRH